MSDEDQIRLRQLNFFKRHHAGCSFAAIAAKAPEQYGWHQSVVSPLSADVERELERAIDTPTIGTLSLIFPSVRSPPDLVSLLAELKKTKSFVVEEQIYAGFNCVGVRAKIRDMTSWTSGFGDFDFFPATRRAPFTEIAIRTKPRPGYAWVMKESPPGVIHLADMNMLGIPKQEFVRLWNSSLKNTKKLLGHSPDMLSAAKTTFAIPTEFFTRSAT